MAISPDGRYVVTVNAGYGTFESQYDQSLAVLDTQTGRARRFPRPAHRARGRSRRSTPAWLSAAMAATSTPAWLQCLTQRRRSGRHGQRNWLSTASGRQDCARAPDSSARVQQLAAGAKDAIAGRIESDQGVPYPAAIAVLGAAGHEKLLVAENLSDDAVLLDATTAQSRSASIFLRSDAVPATYPIAVAVTRDEKRAFVALWNASEIVELDLARGKRWRESWPAQAVEPHRARNASLRLRFSPDEKTLYVALANRDAVAAVNVAQADSFR
jgi:DNA-binding beta-propeller fold protein YncE